MIYSKLSRINNIHQIGTYLLHISKIAGIASLSLSIASCGGGGGGGGSVAATATITSISPVGMVASGTPRALSITGTNFASGMTVSVTDGSTTYTTGTINVQTSNLITTTVTIPAAPTNRYVTVSVKSSTGTLLASTILGVASVSKTLLTHIQPIFAASCGGCHTGGAAQNYLNLSSYSASAGSTGPINTQSVGCSSQLRIKPGDPRTTSSFLIDKIQNTNPCGTGSQMTGSPTTLLPQDITDIIEWVAGGAN